MERILVVKLADVGDLLTITPALRALGSRFPDSEISVLVPPRSRAAIQGNPNVFRALSFDKYRFDTLEDALHPRSLTAAARFARELRAFRFDRVVLMHHLFTGWGRLKFAMLLLASGASKRLGLADQPVWFLTEHVPDRGFGSRHEVEHWLALVAAWHATTEDTRLELAVSADSRAVAARLLPDGLPRPYLALAPGSGSYSLARRWPASQFAAVGHALQREFGGTLVVGGARDEVALAHQVARMSPPGARVLAGLTGVVEWAAVLERCDLCVTNDSGTGHLAAAVNTPVISVFGPSNDRAWRPWDAGRGTVRVVARDLHCRPCLYVGRSLGRREGCGRPVCLTGLRPEAVIAAARDLLAIR